MRLLALLYASLCYALSVAVIAYAIAFVGDFPAPRTLDAGPAAPLATAVLVDLALLLLFAVQHSLMARPAFKAWWTRFVPDAVERSTYVLFSSLVLILVFAQWRPIPATVWDLRAVPAAALALYALFWLGWATALFSTFLISHTEMFGLSQVWRNLRQAPAPDSPFRTPLLYGLVRHPLYLGFLLAFWATPRMTAGHLLFALATTAYILVAIRFEERDLVSAFGDAYRDYRRRTPMILPGLPSPRSRPGSRPGPPR